VRAVVGVGERPFGITVGPEGKRVFTADVGSNTVTVVDIAAAKVVGSVSTGDRPYAVAFARGRGFATDQYADTVTVFDARTLAPVDRIDVGEYPEGISTSSDGQSVVVANWFSNTISVIDAASLETTAEIDVGDGPRAFGAFISPD
jgi:YVTN family beta-propeller protein